MRQHKNGLLVVDKSAGMTSFDVVREVRRLANMRKVGHTGTLDPDATGVLPVALGRCTKLSKFLTLDEKHYAFTAKFGEETDTGDASGEVVRRASSEHIDPSSIEAALDEFRGDIEQVPPVYSAIKVDGKRAYALARAGEEVELDARPVHVASLTLVEWAPPYARFELRCGPGTYVRSVARDLGISLESAAHATQIERLAVGPFSGDQAVALQELNEGNFWSHVLTPLQMVQTLPQYELDRREREYFGHGRPIEVEGQWEPDSFVAARDEEGRLVAVARCESVEGRTVLKPKRVMI